MDKPGVYLVYALAGGHIELVFVRNSAKVNEDKGEDVSTEAYRGIENSIFHGIHFTGSERFLGWHLQMKMEKIENRMSTGCQLWWEAASAAGKHVRRNFGDHSN